MRFAVVASSQNLASRNIASFLEGNLPENIGLHFFDKHICFIDEADSLEADALIFASSHTSSSGKPTLSVHSIGNWGKAELGGRDRAIVPTNSFLVKNLLLGLQKEKEERQLDYEVCLEANHHGPFLSKPTAFVELGSSEQQWKDLKAAEAVANVILKCSSAEGNFKPAIGLGGGHYCPEFSRLVLKTGWALGSICPGYALPQFDEEMLSKAVLATFPKPGAIILDWKGLGKEKQRVSGILGSKSLEILRVRRLLKHS